MCQINSDFRLSIWLKTTRSCTLQNEKWFCQGSCMCESLFNLFYLNVYSSCYRFLDTSHICVTVLLTMIIVLGLPSSILTALFTTILSITIALLSNRSVQFHRWENRDPKTVNNAFNFCCIFKNSVCECMLMSVLWCACGSQKTMREVMFFFPMWFLGIEQ